MNRAGYPGQVAFGRVDAGMCTDPGGFNPHVVTTGEVDDFKARLDTLFDDTNLGAVACSQKLGPDQTNAWKVFYGKWKAFAGTPTGFFETVGAGKNACAFAAQLDGWRDTLNAAGCSIPGPKSIEGSTSNPLAGFEAVLKWTAVGAIAIGGTLVLLEFAPALKALLPKGR